jgi:hypothetical protein
VDHYFLPRNAARYIGESGAVVACATGRYNAKSTMLEQPTLLLHPWSPASAPGPTRAITDPTDGRLLGTVRWTVPPARSWFGWLRRPTLAVHESEDEPLVFTVRRLWSLAPRWEVSDADGHPVAILRRDWILTCFGDCLAWIQRESSHVARFCGPDGREVAQWHLSGGTQRLVFGLDIQEEPFIKMAVLGLVVCGVADLQK